MNRKRLWFESILITILTGASLYLFFLMINISFKPLNYIVNTISDINLNDLYFSSIANNRVDTNIIIIDIDNLDRGGLADLINSTAMLRPKVIGVDVFFDSYRITPHDSSLLSAIDKHRDILVMAKAFTSDGVPEAGYWYLPGIAYGHAGLMTTRNKTGTIREFEPVISGPKGNTPAFSAEVVRLFDPDAAAMLLKRQKATEHINYIGSQNAFLSYHHADLNELTPKEKSRFAGKVVLLGYGGGKTGIPNNFQDLFFTPVGFDLSTNRLPDMYGIVVHANIISMLLNGKYINHTPAWLVYLISAIIVYFHILFFSWLFIRTQLFFQSVSLVAQLLSFILILWMAFLLFSKFHTIFTVSYLLISIALSANILYLYEVIAISIGKLFRLKSNFYNDKLK